MFQVEYNFKATFVHSLKRPRLYRPNLLYFLVQKS